MANQQGGSNAGLAFILGGVVVAVGIIYFIMSGGNLFGGGGDVINVDTPDVVVVPEGDGN